MNNNVRELRKKNGFTVDELRKLSGVGRYYIRLIEDGRLTPDIYMAYKISGAFGLSVYEVFPSSGRVDELANIRDVAEFDLARQAEYREERQALE